jgi:hypothetical protein
LKIYQYDFGEKSREEHGKPKLDGKNNAVQLESKHFGQSDRDNVNNVET